MVTNNNVNRPDVGGHTDDPVAKGSIPAARLAPFPSAERDPSLFELGTVRLGCEVCAPDGCSEINFATQSPVVSPRLPRLALVGIWLASRLAYFAKQLQAVQTGTRSRAYILSNRGLALLDFRGQMKASVS